MNTQFKILTGLVLILFISIISIPKIYQSVPPQEDINVESIENQSDMVLGDSTTSSNKRIEVDLAMQHLHAYENDQLVYDYTISSGTWDRTPNGTFKIWAKIKSQKMSGGSKENGSYYYLPNVPYILFFYNDKIAKKSGYSIHGTYWHNNFGVPMSHGCVNMRTPEAMEIYNWVDKETPIVIYGKYQKPISQK